MSQALAGHRILDFTRLQSGSTCTQPLAWFGDAVPRAGHGSGGSQPGAIRQCKAWQTDPKARMHFTTQAAVWPAVCRAIDEEGWISDAAFATPAILFMKEIAEEPGLRASDTIVEVDHPVRGKSLTVGNPIKTFDSPTVVTRSPLRGEHTVQVLEQLDYSQAPIAALRAKRVI